VNDFLAYLEAKRAVDDWALNDRVFERFADELAVLATRRERPVRIVEVGGGIGSMPVRLAERGVLPNTAQYRLIDLDANAVDYAGEWLPARLDTAGYAVERTSAGLVAESPTAGAESDRRLEIRLESGDAFADHTADGPVDVVIGSAVFDLVDLDRALPWLSSTLESGGLVYAPLTFDGATGFAPSDALDGRIERLYHRHMDEVRDEPGGSRAGRRLLGVLEGDGRPFEVLGVGGSDWILRPQDRAEAVAEDERLVLRHLLETIDGALADYPASTLEPAERRRWIERRRVELDSGEFTLVAHHLDVLARRIG
jgi:hypothetical protein